MRKSDSVWILELWCHIDGNLRCINLRSWTWNVWPTTAFYRHVPANRRCLSHVHLPTPRPSPPLTLRCFPFHHQRVCTTARPTPTETCGTQFWGRSWNASSVLAVTACRTANELRVPATIHVSAPWRQQESAARRVQVRRDEFYEFEYSSVVL